MSQRVAARSSLVAPAVLPNRTVTTDGKVPTILLVDDDVELLKALTKVLEKEGFSVLAHPDAVSAMDHINTTHARFDLVVTDVSMPRMQGLTFLSALKSAFPKVPVIIITAFGDWGEYMEAARDGAYEYLSKPLDKTQLLDTIHHALANGVARV